MTVYYLCGPMAGVDDEHNHPAFHAAATQLRSRGYVIINPAEYGNMVRGWQECMKRDTHALLWCNAVIVLPGWERSKGATLEANLATDLQMPVYEIEHVLADGGLIELPPALVKKAYFSIHVAGYVQQTLSDQAFATPTIGRRAPVANWHTLP